MNYAVQYTDVDPHKIIVNTPNITKKEAIDLWLEHKSDIIRKIQRRVTVNFAIWVDTWDIWWHPNYWDEYLIWIDEDTRLSSKWNLYTEERVYIKEPEL